MCLAAVVALDSGSRGMGHLVSVVSRSIDFDRGSVRTI
jgi:hypothetical protein